MATEPVTYPHAVESDERSAEPVDYAAVKQFKRVASRRTGRHPRHRRVHHRTR